jgi:hypothetical protein
MGENKGWEFKKGNTEDLPTVNQSEAPIGKEKIEDAVLDFLYEKSGIDSELLKISDFNMEFLCWGEQTAFVKIDVVSGNKKTIDLKLVGQDAKNFVDLIRNTRFSDPDKNTPPISN